MNTPLEILEFITAKCCKMADEEKEKEEDLFADGIVEFTTNSEYTLSNFRIYNNKVF